MAKTYSEQTTLMASNNQGSSNTINRDYGMPLDSSSVKENKAAIDTYLSSTKSYVGQIITAADTGTPYVISGASTTRKILACDNGSEDFTIKGSIKYKGVGTRNVITLVETDAEGNGGSILISNGGYTGIGGGESSSTVFEALKNGSDSSYTNIVEGSEYLVLSGDAGVLMYTNTDNNVFNANKRIVFNDGGIAAKGAISSGSTLTVAGKATLNNEAAISSNATVGGTLTVTGAATLNSTAAISSNTTVGGTLTVSSHVYGSDFTAPYNNNSWVAGLTAGAFTVSQATNNSSMTSWLCHKLHDGSGMSIGTLNNNTTLYFTWQNADNVSNGINDNNNGSHPLVRNQMTWDPVNNKLTCGTFNATSDARLKENFQPLESGSILDLPAYKFDYINGAKNQIGCKAQDLQKICPEIVDENPDGYLSIQESKIVYLLLEEVKKLRKEIDELKGV